VLCVAPPAGDWTALHSAAIGAGFDPTADFRAAYWAHRLAYDRGDLSAAEFWTTVLPSPPGRGHLDSLIAGDRAIWLHPNPASLEATARAATRGLRLAVFSNAPVEVADAIDVQPWLQAFHPRFFSCRLRMVKPEPGAYEKVLEGLRAAPDEVVFFDDRPPNVAAAKALGIDARLFESPAQFDDV
jgi:putative hydrolase of the HAD superfamily